MNLNLSLQVNVILFMALLARVMAFLAALPLFSSTNLPLRLRLGLGLALTLVLLPVLPPAWLNAPAVQDPSPWALMLLLAGEVLLGLAVAVAVRLIEEVIILAGTVMGRDLGYAMANVVDPTTMGNQPVLSGLMLQIYLLMLLATDAHHELLRVLAWTLRRFPPGSFTIGADQAETAIDFSARIFSTGFQLALPVFALLLLINISLALMSKFGQEFEVMMLSFPIRLGLGLFLLSSLVPILSIQLGRLGGDLPRWIVNLLD